MLKSVYQNGGFWIGRYEAGDDTYFEMSACGEKIWTSGKGDYGCGGWPTPTSRSGQIPYNQISIGQAKALAEMVLENNPNYTSSLMYGVQWDLVLKYIETKEVARGTELTTIQNALNSDSTSWGNYADSEFTVSNSTSKYAPSCSWGSGLEFVENWINVPRGYMKSANDMSYWSGVELYSTGSNEMVNSKQHICDLAGNLSEWTFEGCTQPVARGGYSVVPEHSFASYRAKDANCTFTGFRVSIF